MAGLRKICRALGGMKVNGVEYVWDYVLDEPVPATEMPIGSPRWQESEKARWNAAMPEPPK